MNLESLLLLHPGLLIRTSILVFCSLITLLVGYLHTLTGLAYEFHVFFILPILAVSWFNGKRFGYGVAVLAAVEWFVADWSLAGDQTYLQPLIRESRLAREDALTQLPNRRQFIHRSRPVQGSQ